MLKGYDFEMNAGESKELLIPVLLCDDTPKDITGATGRIKIARYPEWDKNYLEKYLEIVNEPSGITKVLLEPQDTIDFSGGYIYTIILTHNNQTKVIKRGFIFIHPK